MANVGRNKGVLLFTSGLQFMGPKPRDIPKSGSPSFSKLRCRARLCWRLFWKELVSPIFSASALFRFLVQAVVLFLVFYFMDAQKMIEQSTTAVLGTVAFVAAMVLWTIFQATVAPFRVSKAERSLGQWKGARFVYNEPLRVLTTEVSPAENGQFHSFEVPDVEPGSLVDYRIEIDGPAQRLNCIIFGAYCFRPVEEMLNSARFTLHGRVTLRRDRSLDLHCHSLPNTLPTIIRAYILAWEIDPSILMDYTDLKTGARVVLGPPDGARHAVIDGGRKEGS